MDFLKGKRARWILGLLLGLLSSEAGEAACDQTLSPGANVALAVSNAPAGSTICLNAGNYGEIALNGMTKSSPVTLQSVSGRTAVASFSIFESSQLVLRSMTISDLYIAYQARNLTISQNTITGQTVINMGPNGGNYGNANIHIDGNSFDGISVCDNCYEGRVQVISELPCGVRLTNNHIGGAGESDGIQVGANGLEIGPGNVFDGIVQANYSRHVDAIQLYGSTNTKIIGNYFVNNNVQIMAPDGGSGEIVTDNVFVGNGDYRPAIQFGSLETGVFSHNTVINIDVHINKKSENPTSSSNVTVKNNIMINGGFTTTDSSGRASCAGCTFDRNLFSNGSLAMGTSTLVGLPTFIGGTQPSSWPGYQLSDSSLGYRAATDSLDVGATRFGAGSVPTPTPTPVPTPIPTPTPTPTPVPSDPIVTGSTLFGTSVPTLLSNTDGAGVNYELGLRFVSKTEGKIKAIRFFKASSESGDHIGKIWSSSGQLLASVKFTSETTSGWQQQSLPTPLSIQADTEYVVAVNTGNTYYVATVNGLTTSWSSGDLTALASGGVYGPVGQLPTQSWQASNYFRDVVFEPSSAPPPSSADTIAPTVTITSPTSGARVARGSRVTINATAADNVGVTKVEFYVDNNLVCTDTSAPYSCSWLVPSRRIRTYYLRARAFDAAGNSASTPATAVTSR